MKKELIMEQCGCVNWCERDLRVQLLTGHNSVCGKGVFLEDNLDVR